MTGSLECIGRKESRSQDTETASYPQIAVHTRDGQPKKRRHAADTMADSVEGNKTRQEQNLSAEIVIGHKTGFFFAGKVAAETGNGGSRSRHRSGICGSARKKE